jgi:hypothetical protein
MISTQRDFKVIRNSIDRFKLVALLLFAGLAFFLQVQKPAAATEAQSKRLFEIIGMDVPFDQRVGINDGVVFAIHFGGDTHGNLDTCG